VFHLHVHVIPRYDGDVDDPRGGVRCVIAGRGFYGGVELRGGGGGGAVYGGLVRRVTAGLGAAGSFSDFGASDGSFLVRGGEGDPLLGRLVGCLAGAAAVDMAVAFTMISGVALLEEHLRDVLDRGGRVRILTGDYLGVTEPRALLRLLDLRGDIKICAFQSGRRPARAPRDRRAECVQPRGLTRYGWRKQEAERRTATRGG
jgi:hypothetical protein